MNNKLVTTLLDIPGALFRELAVQDGVNEQSFKESLGDIYSIKVAKSIVSGKNGAHTLVYRRHNCHVGRFHYASIAVYNYPAKLEQFGPHYNYYQGDPLLVVRTFADDPPYDPKPSSDSTWEEGKGFWVMERLCVKYGNCGQDWASITSDFEDWEFGFLITLQQRAHDLVREIPIRGHWQYDWNPHGNFSQKPRCFQ